MSQNQQYKKVKLFRTLKIVFYSLGLPLFLVTVFLSAIRFIGHDPFMGETATTIALGFFTQIESYVTAPALYGFWIACALWLFISIVHIILSKTVKNPKVRMLSVLAVCLVVMLGAGFVMDAVFEAKVTEIMQNAPAGVEVKDYKTQLSYYRHLSSNAEKKDDTLNLIEKVNLLENVYNVEMEGANKGGTAGNIANKPVSYWNIIDDEGNQGVDISFVFNEKTGGYDLQLVADGDLSKEIEGEQLVRLAPNANGQLEINGKVYSHYWYKQRATKAGEKIYVWYTKDMMPVGTEYENGTTADKAPITEGVYGTGIYNQNGMLSDGWVFSIYNVLEILEDYYEGQAEMEKYSALLESVYEDAETNRDAYYSGLIPDQDGNYADPWLQTLYTQEIEIGERFSLTRRELDALVAKLGALLGNNSLFDFLLKPNEDGESGLGGIADQFGLGDILKPILEKLQKGMSFVETFFGGDAAKMTEVAGYIRAALGLADSVAINDIYIVLAYAGATDALGVKRDNLYIALVRDNGAGAIGTNPANVKNGGDVLVDIDFSDKLLDEEESDYAFDLDHLSTFLNTAINGLLGKFGVNLKSILVDNAIGKLIGGLLIKDITIDGKTYKGLEISGLQIPLFDEDYNAAIDISAILTNLLSSLYYYQSPTIKPVWEFAGWDSLDKDYTAASEAYKKFSRAEYEAVAHGGLIGSVLIGDNLGTGAYPSSLGLTDLKAVQQLKTDLSYKREFYPLYAARDVIMFFTGIVILFYFLSFVAHEKEIEYATGKLVAKTRDKKKGAKRTDANDVATDETTANADASETDAVSEGEDALLAQENTDKEVL